MTLLIPQLILTLDPEGRLIAEVPGPSGARRKIILPEGAEASALRAELYDQREAQTRRLRDERQKGAEDALERHHRIFARTLRAHGPAFAEKTVGRRPGDIAPRVTSTRTPPEAIW